MFSDVGQRANWRPSAPSEIASIKGMVRRKLPPIFPRTSSIRGVNGRDLTKSTAPETTFTRTVSLVSKKLGRIISRPNWLKFLMCTNASGDQDTSALPCSFRGYNVDPGTTFAESRSSSLIRPLSLRTRYSIVPPPEATLRRYNAFGQTKRIGPITRFRCRVPAKTALRRLLSLARERH